MMIYWQISKLTTGQAKDTYGDNTNEYTAKYSQKDTLARDYLITSTRYIIVNISEEHQ